MIVKSLNLGISIDLNVLELFHSLWLMRQKQTALWNLTFQNLHQSLNSEFHQILTKTLGIKKKYSDQVIKKDSNHRLKLKHWFTSILIKKNLHFHFLWMYGIIKVKAVIVWRLSLKETKILLPIQHFKTSLLPLRFQTLQKLSN